jgi:hypothetical protein
MEQQLAGPVCTVVGVERPLEHEQLSPEREVELGGDQPAGGRQREEPDPSLAVECPDGPTTPPFSTN